MLQDVFKRRTNPESIMRYGFVQLLEFPDIENPFSEGFCILNVYFVSKWRIF